MWGGGGGEKKEEEISSSWKITICQLTEFKGWSHGHATFISLSVHGFYSQGWGSHLAASLTPGQSPVSDIPA